MLYKWAEDGNISDICKLKDKYDCSGVIEYKDGDGWTALMYASINGHIDVVKILIDMGANVNNKNEGGWTALMIASNEEIKKLLRAKGAK